MRDVARRRLELALEVVTVLLMGSLALVVVVGVGFRKAGAALVWYDEVASILLAWLTFYGAALAALKRAHIGFPKLVDGLSVPLRRAAIITSEVFVIGFFLVVAWAGWQVFLILGGETLVGLPWMPQRITQSVVPIGALLFIVAELLTLPDVLRGPIGYSATEGGEHGGTGVET